MSSLSGLRAISGYDPQTVTPNPGELVADFKACWAAAGGDDHITPNQVTKRLFEHEADGFEKVGIERKVWQNPVLIAYISQQNIRTNNPGKPFSPDAPIPAGQVYQSLAGTSLRQAVQMATNMPNFEDRLRQELAAMNTGARSGGNMFNPPRGPTGLSTVLPVGPEPGDPRI